MDIITTDYSSVYSVKDFYQKHILPIYFDEDKLSLSTVGDLGLFLDITGTTTEDMMNIMGRYINETMPGRANLPDFIYANAANYGITNILAKPAKMPMFLIVKEKDILTYGKVVRSSGKERKEFILDSDMNIIVDDLRFSIPYDIKIISGLYNGTYNHMAIYVKDYTNDLIDESNPYIKIMKTNILGDVYLVLSIYVYQYTRVEHNEIINTNSILNIPYIDVPYNDQLCNIEVFYTEAGSTKKIQLLKRMDGAPPLINPFVFYKFLDDHTIRLSFANDDRYFLPGYNSNIQIFIYETSGANGNFGYNRDTTVVYIRAASNKEETSYNSTIFPLGASQGNSVGGRDQLTLEKIKLLTTEAQVTVKSYTTENDLNTYFTDYTSVYEHDAIFYKQRDDYAGREYGCFSRIGDGIDIFPTNTLDIRLKTDEADKHFQSLRQYIIKAGTVFQYESSTESKVLIKKPEGVETQSIEYALAPLMIVTTKPNQVNFYMNTVSHSVQLDYSEINLDSPFNFVANKFTIKRNAIQGEDEYTLGLELSRVDGEFSNIGLASLRLQASNGELYTNRLKVIIIFKTTTGNYIPLTLVQEEGELENTSGNYVYKFTGKVGTTDMIDNERILLTNLLKNSDNSTDERLIDIINPDIEIGVFYDFDDIPGSGHHYTDIECVKNLTMCNVYKPKKDSFWFAYPLNLMRSHVMFEDRSDTSIGFGFYIKQVPVFGAEFLLDKNTDIDKVLTDISSEHDFLTDIVKLLHGMFTINMKFFNTYGRSRNFYIGYGTKDELINHVNCNFSIGVKFYDGIIIEDYLDNVKIFIKEYFEKVNKLEEGTNRAYISRLSQLLHDTFPDQIEFAIFYSINGYDSKYQTLRTLTPIDEITSPDYVPEYLTLKASDVSVTVL